MRELTPNPLPCSFAGKEPCAAQETGTAITSSDGWRSQGSPVLGPSLFPWVLGKFGKVMLLCVCAPSPQAGTMLRREPSSSSHI